MRDVQFEAVKFSSRLNGCDDCIIVPLILRVANQLSIAIKRFEYIEAHIEKFDVLSSNIGEVVSYWSGNTWVGVRKSPMLSNAFQKFFSSLHSLLVSMYDSRIDMFRGYAEIALYRGRVYRYLGYDQPGNNRPLILPEYNDIFVSWTQHERVFYFEEKLYEVTRLTYDITAPDYGIALSAFPGYREHEAEVVFPTKRSGIICVEQLVYHEGEGDDNHNRPTEFRSVGNVL